MSAISVFGLGYVGCVSAACFAKEGHRVIGVDVSQSKVDLVNSGKPTILEAGITEMVAETRAAGRLSATTSSRDAVMETEVSLVCVGTPSRDNASLELKYVERVCEEIGEAIAKKSTPHVVVIRSTVLPGTNYDLVIPTLEKASGKKHGEGFAVCSNPEFLREGSSVKDFYDPPFTLIGGDDPASVEVVKGLYQSIEAPVFVTALRVAEMVKYVCNCFHGLKVGFANEIGNICKAVGVDSHEVMRIVCEDRKLNISPAYMKPGFAFGGSCLPKDLRAMVYRAKQADIDVPILRATLESNNQQVQRAFKMVMATGHKKVGVLGMTFKAGTDDLRESPMVTLVEYLIGKGIQLSIYDRDISESRVMGANKEYIEKEIPHIWTMMKPTVADVLKSSETVVIGNGSAEFRTIRDQLADEQILIDLVRAFGPQTSEKNYRGISW
ncbi:MAG: UDP-glucose/GDP-mannose dehydrogenase family protein [Labilithrix sp.]|nr:UDP-glucose/GDP-mannose dehydrogenase family protein [Labilithrix sp.]MCW5813763.1 UDP-glucose/GDP-mannose dehydrogenase family protein [Labilithrix sp.]